MANRNEKIEHGQKTLLKGTTRELIKLSAPLAISNLSWSVLHLVDTVLVGKLGQAALAAMGMCMVIDSLFFVVVLSTGIALQVLISRARGEQNITKVNSLFWTGGTLILIFSSLLGYMLLMLLPEVLMLFIKDNQVRKLTYDYLNIKLVFAPVTGLFVLLRGLYFGSARTLFFSTTIILINLVNIFLDYVLIFGKLGFPRLEIKGAALATMISVSISIVILLVGIKLNQNYFLIDRPSFQSSIISEFTRLSLPLIGQYLTAISGWVLFFTFVEKTNQFILAVTTAGTALLSMLSVMGWAMGPMVSTIISNLLGQKKISTAFRFLNRALLLAIATHALAGSLFVLLAKYPALLYASDSHIVDGILQIKWHIALILCLFSIGTTAFNALVGTGSTKLAWLCEATAVISYVSFAYITTHILQPELTLIWFSEAIYWAVLFITASFIFYSGLWIPRKNLETR